jgi:hypothetical protein
MNQTNLFSNLHRWASHQDENFHTESLVTLVRTLLDRVPELGVEMIGFLTAGLVSAAPEDAPRIDLKTQVSTDEGLPDVEVRYPGARVFVEVKTGSAVRPDQLRRYRAELGRSIGHKTGLILLTRHPPGELLDDSRPDLALRWFQMATWVEDRFDRLTQSDPVSHYLAEQYLNFLRDQNMHSAAVGWELPNGIRALRTFLDMLSETITALGWKPRPSMSLEWFGYYLTVTGGHVFWVGTHPQDPGYICFTTEETPINALRAAELPKGEVSDGRWRVWADLTGEETFFFCRSAASQRQWLESYIRECVELALTVAGVPQ